MKRKIYAQHSVLKNDLASSDLSKAFKLEPVINDDGKPSSYKFFIVEVYEKLKKPKLIL